jgi:hypothetical protein
MQITVRMAGISRADRGKILVVTKKEGYIGQLVFCKIACDSSNDVPLAGSSRVVLSRLRAHNTQFNSCSAPRQGFLW